MGKKGQLTVFILLGIFILAATAVFLYLRKDRATMGIEESIPPEFQPIKIFVEDCLQQYTQSGVALLGTQGGYTYFPDRIANNPDSTIAFTPNNPIRVPYWQYKGETRVPSIANMEQSLSDYLLGNIDRCLQDFAVFGQKFSISKTEVPEARVTIGEQEVVVTLTMPLDAAVKGGADRARMSKFNAQVPVKLRKIHRLAADIFNAAAQTQFFEDITLELMTAGTDIPFSDISLSCRKPRWRKSELARELQELLYYNIPRVRFAQTNYPPFLRPLTEYEEFRRLTPEDVRNGNYPRDAPPDLYEYYHFLFPGSADDYSDLTAGAYFQKEWQFAFDAHPSNGDRLEADGGKADPGFLKFLCVQAYRFAYDVEYPVQIVLRDPQAFGGGFAFRFAIPVRINRNAPDHGGTGVAFFDLPEGETDYCADQREEETIIYAKDLQTLEDLSDANITFRCMNQYSCDVGTTAFDGSANRLRTHLPAFCRPGELLAERTGYLPMHATLGEDPYLDIAMPKLLDKTFRIVKRPLERDALGAVTFLEPDEQAVVLLSAVNYEAYSESRRYPTDEELESLPLLEAEAAYDVTVVLLDAEGKPIGGWSGNWSVNADAAASANEVIFTAVEPIPRVAENAEEQMLEQITEPEVQRQAIPVLR